MATQAAFTSDAVRDGEPQALAALCTERGAPVLAYCEHVAAPRQAAPAAADAFALMRSVLVAAAATDQLDVHALLHKATRRAAAARGVHAAAPHNAPEGCPGLEPTLVAWLEQPADEDRKQLDDHVARCRACSVAMRRLEAAQRAFERPPRARLPLHVAEQIITDLVAGAPVKAAGGDADTVRAQALQHVRDMLGEPPAPSQAAPARAPAPDEAASPRLELPPVAAAQDAAPAQAASAAPWPIFSATSRPPADAVPDDVASPAAEPSDSEAPSGDDAPRASGPRRAPPRVSPTLSSLVGDICAAVRYRVLGPGPGATERPRQRLPIARRRGAPAAGRRGFAETVNSRGAELGAIGLFATVAIAVALMTFLLASSPPKNAASRPDPGLPAGQAGAVQPASDRTQVSSKPSQAPRAPSARSEPRRSRTTRAKPRRSAESGGATSSARRAAARPRALSRPSRRSTTPSTPPPPPPAPPPSPPPPPNPAPAEPDGEAVPGGEFSRGGET